MVSPSPSRPKAGLALTFDVLTASSDQATDVLLPSIDAPQRSIRDGALASLLKRRSALAQREILARLGQPEREAQWRDIVAQYPGSLLQGIRDAVLGDDRALCQVACETAVRLQEYELLPTLITALESPNPPHADLLGPVLVDLTEVLRLQIRAPRDRRRGADPELLRQRLLPKLEAVVQTQRGRAPALIESYLILADARSRVLRETLDDPMNTGYVPFAQVLAHSRRAAVMELILELFKDPQGPTTIGSAVSSRADAEFLDRLVRLVGQGASAALIAQLRRIDSFAWARGPLRVYDTLDGAGQAAALQILMLSGMNRLEVFRSVEHLLLRGKPAGRAAAAAALSEFNGSEANQLARRALGDKDPAIVAAVTRQLRQRGMPGALQKLIELLEHAHPAVREAAREALSEFTFARFIAMYDTLGDEARRSTGAMVRKIDPQTDELLIEEMQSESRSRRLRAVSAAVSMDAVRVVGPTLLELLRDEDHLVRLEAARALEAYPTEATRAALQQALGDRSALVQEALRRTLEQVETALERQGQEASHV